MQVRPVERVSEEVYEIVGSGFGPCGGRLLSDGACSSVARFAIRRLHIGLYCGLGPQAHKLSWLPNLPWAKPADFVEPGPFAGWVPEGAFPPRHREQRRKRRGGWDLSESVRFEFEVRIRQRGAKCVACEATWFRGERNSTDALVWLRAHERSGLFVEVNDALLKMVPKPTTLDPTWYDRLPTDLRLQVKYRFDDSRLQAHHLLSLAFLRAAKLREGTDFSPAVHRFGIDGLAMPLCDKCSREKGTLVLKTRDELLVRWAAYRFGGNIAAACSHPDYVHFEYLAGLAYETKIVAGLVSASHQRERRA